MFKKVLFISAALSAAAASAAPFTFENLVQTIRDQKVTSLETLLPLLPEAMRSNYVLMHDSESLQGATFQNPRIAMFGSDASLTCAFNGASDQAGFDALECFQYRSAEHRFDFHQIRFPTAQNHLTEVAVSALNQSVDGRVACTSCHGADPRPNWNDYSFWPNTYGEGDESAYKHPEAFKNFQDAMDKHPRYRWLKKGVGAEAFGTLDSRMNLKFSDFVGRMNAWRAARIMESKVSRQDAIGFAVSGLRCSLNESEKTALQGTAYEDSLDLGKVFQKIGISLHEWTTRPLGFDKPHLSSYVDYEHQSGFTLQLSSIGMVEVKRLADGGNTALQEGLKKIAERLPSQRPGESFYFEALAQVLPDPDHFGAFEENTGYLCPELKRVFVDSYRR